MVKTFLIGIILGIVAAAVGLYAKPVVDQAREISYISVAPNGGNRETFRINIPIDRVMIGAAGQSSRLPAGLEWPEDDILAKVSTEMFKVRNERDVIVGIAARTVAVEDDSSVVDWVLHLPARGSLLINMDATVTEDGHRVGELRTGTQEFQSMMGFVAERWVSDTSGDEDAPDGHIELLATYVSRVEESIE